jgi:hypothetical protein
MLGCQERHGRRSRSGGRRGDAPALLQRTLGSAASLALSNGGCGSSFLFWDASAAALVREDRFVSVKAVIASSAAGCLR